jgi:1A family penicillin-binding protein
MKSFTSNDRHDLVARIKSVATPKRLKIAGIILAGFLLVTPAVTYAYYAHDISNRDRLMNRNDTGIILKDRNGKVFYEYGTVNANNDVPLAQISDNMQHALIASEDHEFYTHPGFSIRGIAAAGFADLMHRDATKYGGSTITQQLVKNRLLSSNKNLFRKYQEVSMAVAVERKYTKNEILDMYLNSVYFGEGAFGISEAAKTYFNTTPDKLTLAQSSQLVGLLPAPSSYSPISGDKQLAKEQQARVLRKMVENKYISASQKTDAESVQLAYNQGDSGTANTHAQHYAAMVIDQLKQKYGEEKVARSGYEVTTGLDLDWQIKAEQIVKQRVAVTSKLGGRNASLVAEDPINGEVRALVGSVDWNNTAFGQVNMATALRQPGSSFKPIYYSKALEQKLVTPATILDDSKTTFGGTYTPSNYDNRYKGKMPLRSALAESRNVPAVQVMQKVGVDNAVKAAQEMGLSTVTDPQKYGLALALGTAEIRLVDMVNAYSAFANQGEQHNQVLVTQVQDKFGKTVFKNKTTTKRVRSEGAAYLTASILSDPAARAPTYGTTLNIPSRDVALKTGTTNENRDAWTIGFTPNLVIGAWTGNNEHEPMIGLAGGSSAGIIFKQAMTQILPSLPKEEFVQPSSVVQVQVCKGTEARATSNGSNTYGEYFLKDDQPTTNCNAQTAPAPAPQKDEKKNEKDSSDEETPAPTTKPNNGNGNGNGNNEENTTTTPPTQPAPTTPPPPAGGQGGGEGGGNNGGGNGGTTTGGGSGGGETTPPPTTGPGTTNPQPTPAQ